MRLDLEHPENRGVLVYLRRGGRENRPPVASPSSVPDAYMGCGSHPDVVERVWDELGAGLSASCRCLVYGSPALVDDESGVVLCLALGTSSALRVPKGRVASAKGQELQRVHLYTTSNTRLDLADFGPSWRFGGWNRVEEEWIRAVCLELR